MGKRRWEHGLSWFYYTSGSIYYAYHWVLIISGGGLASAVVGIVLALGSPYLWAVLGGAAGVLFLTAVAAGGRARMIRLTTENPGLRHISVVHDYDASTPDAYSYKRSIEARVRSVGVSHYFHKFSWTGVGAITIGDVTQGFSAALFEEPIGTRTTCLIQFPRMLAKDELLTFYYSLELKDSEGAAKPFLGVLPDFPTGRIVLRVKLPSLSNVKTYKRMIFANHLSEIPVFEEIVPVPTGALDISWEVKHPKLGYNYKLAWGETPSRPQVTSGAQVIRRG